MTRSSTGGSQTTNPNLRSPRHMGRSDLNHYQHFSPPSSSSKVGLSVASKAGSTLSTGSSEGNMESLVDYHKVDKLSAHCTQHIHPKLLQYAWIYFKFLIGLLIYRQCSSSILKPYSTSVSSDLKKILSRCVKCVKSPFTGSGKQEERRHRGERGVCGTGGAQ